MGKDAPVILMEINKDFIGFYREIMGNYRVLMGFNREIIGFYLVLMGFNREIM